MNKAMLGLAAVGAVLAALLPGLVVNGPASGSGGPRSVSVEASAQVIDWCTIVRSCPPAL